MASDIVKDFVKQQTKPIQIGVPKSVKEYVEPKEDKEDKKEAKSGRKTISIYISEEKYEKLKTLQHHRFETNLNRIVGMAIDEFLKKYETD